MSAVLAVQRTATLDEFLADPVVADELFAVVERLMGDKPLTFNGYTSVAAMRVKVQENGEIKRGTNEPKRTAWGAEDLSDLILKAWREHRP